MRVFFVATLLIDHNAHFIPHISLKNLDQAPFVASLEQHIRATCGMFLNYVCVVGICRAD